MEGWVFFVDRQFNKKNLYVGFQTIYGAELYARKLHDWNTDGNWLFQSASDGSYAVCGYGDPSKVEDFCKRNCLQVPAGMVQKWIISEYHDFRAESVQEVLDNIKVLDMD